MTLLELLERYTQEQRARVIGESDRETALFLHGGIAALVAFADLIKHGWPDTILRPIDYPTEVSKEARKHRTILQNLWWTIRDLGRRMTNGTKKS